MSVEDSDLAYLFEFGAKMKLPFEINPLFLAQQQAEKQPDAPGVGIEEPQTPIIKTVESLDPSMIKEEEWSRNATQLQNWANKSHKNAAKRN